MPPAKKLRAAWVFGSIEPAANCPSSICFCNSATETSSSDCSSGLPKLILAASTDVKINSVSASRRSANLAAPKSLSITAATPFNCPASSCKTGMPPPPVETTVTPAETSDFITSASTMVCGFGEGTTRRQPRPASSFTV